MNQFFYDVSPYCSVQWSHSLWFSSEMFPPSKLISMVEISVSNNFCRLYLPLLPSESTGAHRSLNSGLKLTQLVNNKSSTESNSSDSTHCCGLTRCGHAMDFLTTDQHRKQAAKTAKFSFCFLGEYSQLQRQHEAPMREVSILFPPVFCLKSFSLGLLFPVV